MRRFTIRFEMGEETMVTVERSVTLADMEVTGAEWDGLTFEQQSELLHDTAFGEVGFSWEEVSEQ